MISAGIEPPFVLQIAKKMKLKKNPAGRADLIAMLEGKI